ncbi:cation transporter [Bacillus sp. M6-12]|uniref:cation diffusion facilitator family transporter n=1 Tax=Bacillus sp. M6-12 TaxID=2054166 RepID=UPI000C790A76|nr:cation diffusion facilitator family transporter [Bacillus sp. M6-12]PLS19588.1 cation transporter [Bacillus sp. M6-12]
MSHHHHEHHHSHHHHDASQISKTKLFWVVLMNLLITVAEFIGGILSGSLALLSDALHNLSDTIAILLSYVSIRLSSKSANERKMFGYKRANILSAFINSAVLLALSVYLSFEAVQRFIHQETVNGNTVIIVSLIGLVANLVSVLLLSKDSKHSLNIRSSYLHLMSDMVSSVIVLFSGIMIKYFHVYWIDPVFTIIINILIVKSVYSVLKESIHILMEGSPENISIEEMKKELKTIENVIDITEVKAWSLDDNHICIELKMKIEDMKISESNQIKHKIEHILEEHYGARDFIIEFTS